MRLTPIRSWELWSAPKRVVALVLLVDSAAVLLAVWAAVRESVDAGALVRFGVLAASGLGYIAAGRRVERARLLFAVSRGTVYVDVMSVWTLSAAVLLPGVLTAALIVLLYGQIWLRASERDIGRPRLHRFVYTISAAMITCHAVHGLLNASGLQVDGRGPAMTALVFAFAIPVYITVNTAVVAMAMYLSSGESKAASLFGSKTDNCHELVTLGLGSAATLSLLYAPWAAVLVLPAVFLLQHQALLRQLVEAATLDGKTALLNATAWRQLAQREILRVTDRGGSAAVLVLDMDHFKQLNDSHGHLAGDAALKVVGETLADELRGYDAVGRFGGEEFVAVLPDTEVLAAERVAQRLRRRIEGLELPIAGASEPVTVTASIGVAACPEHGDSLEAVLGAADAAMYEAKRAGRNAVRAAPAVAVTGRSLSPAVAVAP